MLAPPAKESRYPHPQPLPTRGRGAHRVRGGVSSRGWCKQRSCGDEREGNSRARGQALRRDDRGRLQGAGRDGARRSLVYAFLGRDRHQGELAAVDAVGQGQVQERQLHRPQGAPDRRGGAHHGTRRDRGRDRRPATQLEALVPQRLGEDARGLEVRRLAVDAARGLSECSEGSPDGAKRHPGLPRHDIPDFTSLNPGYLLATDMVPREGGHFLQEERTCRRAKSISWFERRCRTSASARNSMNGMEHTICLWRWINSVPRKAGASGAVATHRSTTRSISSKTWQRCATVSTPRPSSCSLPTSIRHGPK